MVEWNDETDFKGFSLGKILRNKQKYSICARTFSLCGHECVGFIFILGFTVVNYEGKIVL